MTLHFLSVSIELSPWYMCVALIFFILMSRMNAHTFFFEDNPIQYFLFLTSVCFIRDLYWFFEIVCFWFFHFLVSSRMHPSEFWINVYHWKVINSNLGRGCECRYESVCKTKAFTNIEKSDRYTGWNQTKFLSPDSITIENETLLLFQLLERIHLQTYYWYGDWVELLQTNSNSKGYTTDWKSK